jgi:hypothetical protein
MILNYDGYSVGRIYVADKSEVTINAAGNAYVVVDAVDFAQICVYSSDNAKVIVNAYANTMIIGTESCKYIRKNTPTYDL